MTNTSSHPSVLIFDSGVGGLSVLAEIRNHLPWCHYSYACDNQAFPYGTKPEQELIARVDTALKALIAQIAPDIVVIACNTASTVALPHIRAHFDKPVVGVVPAIKPAAQLSKTGVIGLLATPATIARPYTQWLIDEFAGDLEVVRLGSAELVAMAERKLRGEPPAVGEIQVLMAPLFSRPELDTVVLACTHFPLLKDELVAAAPRPLTWVDSGEAIARRVASFTGETLEDHRDIKGPFHCWLTAADESGALNAGLKALGADSIQIISIA